VGRSLVEIGQAPGTKCGWKIPQSISDGEPDLTFSKQDRGSSGMSVPSSCKHEISAEQNGSLRAKLS
jgi:hypothetical protein